MQPQPLTVLPYYLFLRFLAVAYAYSAIVYYGNLLGFGEIPWSEMPQIVQINDIGYALLDTLAAVGLWRKQTWGIALFLLIALSQLVLYLGFPQDFIFSDERQQTVRNFINFHKISLSLFLALFALKKWGRNSAPIHKEKSRKT
ncbi:hypothetical protein [Baaleninema sp.]|uniref:hypothetical protein n=1 Tax=Baaleninema sp. TaxID=3101197 RepID=UPI003CFEE6F3